MPCARPGSHTHRFLLPQLKIPLPRHPPNRATTGRSNPPARRPGQPAADAADAAGHPSCTMARRRTRTRPPQPGPPETAGWAQSPARHRRQHHPGKPPPRRSDGPHSAPHPEKGTDGPPTVRRPQGLSGAQRAEVADQPDGGRPKSPAVGDSPHAVRCRPAVSGAAPPRQQPARACPVRCRWSSCLGCSASPGPEPGQPVVHRLRRCCLIRRLDGLGLGHVFAGQRCIFLDQELHRAFYSPAIYRAALGEDFFGVEGVLAGAVPQEEVGVLDQ